MHNIVIVQGHIIIVIQFGLYVPRLYANIFLPLRQCFNLILCYWYFYFKCDFFLFFLSFFPFFLLLLYVVVKFFALEL